MAKAHEWQLKASTKYWLPEPKDPRTRRRRPHVPSSKTNNVKEPRAKTPAPNSKAGQPAIPLFSVGDLAVRHVGDQAVRRATQWRRPVR